MVNTRGGLLTLATLWWLPTASCESGDVSVQTSVTASASSYDERPLLEGGCYTEGCEPDLTLDRFDTDVTQSRWSCEATEAEPCYITYTFGEAQMVERVFLYFTNVTEDMSVIVSTLESSTDDDEEYVAQIIETVSAGWLYTSVLSLDVYLQPVPLGAAVRIQADLPAGAWVSILETYISVTLEDDEETASSSSGGSVSGSLVGSLVFAIFFCCVGCCIYQKCFGTPGQGASASASASASSSANNNVQIMMQPAPAHHQTAFYPQAPMNGQGPVYATPVAA